MNIISTLKSLPARAVRRPLLALGALAAALACAAILAAGASALAGRDPGPKLGPSVQVGDTSRTHADSNHGRADDRDRTSDDGRQDVTIPVTPGSLPADSDHENHENHDSDWRDLDHD